MADSPSWIVLGKAPAQSNRVMVHVRCSGCGVEATVSRRDIETGRSRCCRSCGHLKHGHNDESPEYGSWRAMRRRCGLCAGATARETRNYSGRGIACCERWLSFENFLADMGPRPDGTTLDRIDPNGNYEPGNCRWATSTEQARNKRTTRLDEATVADIRARYDLGERPKDIAALYGIRDGMVTAVGRRHTWKDVAPKLAKLAQVVRRG